MDESKPKKKLKTNAMQRSLNKLRREGWTVCVVERKIPRPGRPFPTSRDAFGFGDILACRLEPKLIALVQTSTAARWNDHKRKILGPIHDGEFATDEERQAAERIIADAITWANAGGVILLHGWSYRLPHGLKFEEKRWVCREERLYP